MAACNFENFSQALKRVYVCISYSGGSLDLFVEKKQKQRS